jgi:hypothetical protein
MQRVNGDQHADAERAHRDLLVQLAAELLGYVVDALEGDGDPRAIRELQLGVYRLWRCERRHFAFRYLSASPAEDAAYRAKSRLFDGPDAINDFRRAEAAFDRGHDLYAGLRGHRRAGKVS